MRVCLLTEGTYPYVRGGVSTWCHDLIAGLPDIDFTVYAIAPNPSGRLEYELPPNVSRLLTVPLWGHERLSEYNQAELGKGRRARSVSALKQTFIPLFNMLLDQIVHGIEYAKPEELAYAFGELYLYFREHDYDWTMRRRETWDAALRFFSAEPWYARFMTSLEAIELVRSLYRYLIPLAIETPPADLYHSSVAGLCAIPGIAAHYVDGSPVMLTEHGIYLRERVLALARAGFPFSDRVAKKNLFSAIARATYASCDIIAPVCKYNVMWEQYYGVPMDRVRVIYNGVDASRFADRALDPPVPTVSAVLRIDPLKDVPTMIASAKVVRERIPNVRYKIWGPAPDAEYLAQCERLIDELALRDTVQLMGSTTDPASAFGDAHVCALSSISEGFPYSVIEAMMCAKPVVATDVGGVREAIDRYGAVVPPKRPDRLGEEIAKLLAQPETARALGKEARVFALANFTQASFLARYHAAYAELTAGRRVPAA
ncbi:MAG TPA: GT4 family glycosyltransferase PelF [Candidatus Binatia bacterium]|nr:GT4 family glycosyltransferase PelF [Candidatus Binatia bacterium]